MLGAAWSIGALLVAIFTLMAGGGLLSTLVSVRLEAGGASAIVVGLVATAYFVGLTIGSLAAFPVVARAGHIRAFAAFASLFSATTLALAIHVDPLFWSLLRLVQGLCTAGVFVCLESWLNERATPATRGAILATYMIFLYSGQAVGQLLLNLGGPLPSLPFIAASILLSLAVIPVTLTRIPAPAPPDSGVMPLAKLFRTSPLGLVGAVATGLMLGAFYGLGPVFASGSGLVTAGTALFMSATILGGVTLQWPLGRLSDLIDRRKVIVGTFAATLLVCGAMVYLAEGRWQLVLVGALFGGTCFALYPLCVAHMNDHLGSGERVAATGGLVLVYSLGAAAGPLLAGGLMTVTGPRGLFLFIGLCAAAVLLFAAIRIWRSPAVPGERQGPYQILPRTTPAAAALDPLSPE